MYFNHFWLQVKDGVLIWMRNLILYKYMNLCKFYYISHHPWVSFWMEKKCFDCIFGLRFRLFWMPFCREEEESSKTKVSWFKFYWRSINPENFSWSEPSIWIKRIFFAFFLNSNWIFFLVDDSLVISETTLSWA